MKHNVLRRIGFVIIQSSLEIMTYYVKICEEKLNKFIDFHENTTNYRIIDNLKKKLKFNATRRKQICHYAEYFK